MLNSVTVNKKAIISVLPLHRAYLVNQISDCIEVKLSAHYADKTAQNVAVVLLSCQGFVVGST